VNCDRCRDLASEALDGALSDSVLADFRAHVDACPPCGAFLAELRESLALLMEIPEVQVDADRFDRAVWAAVRASQRAEAPGWRGRLTLPGGFRLAELFTWRWAPVTAVGTAALAIAFSQGPNAEHAGGGGVASGPIRGTQQASLPGFTPALLENDGGWEISELSVRAPIPQPVEQYLQHVDRQERLGQDLRLDTGGRLRGSDYIYPFRRIEVGGSPQIGTPVGQTYSRPGSAEPRPAVIAF
jgi:hypothetical protein